jgi:hypothetical protein
MVLLEGLIEDFDESVVEGNLVRVRGSRQKFRRAIVKSSVFEPTFRQRFGGQCSESVFVVLDGLDGRRGFSQIF